MIPCLRPLGVLPFLLALASPCPAQKADPVWSVTGYIQDGWPKQTATNRSIRDINDTFGTHTKTWSNVANLNVGVLALRDVVPGWKAGVEVDWSSGSIKGDEKVSDFGSGPGRMAFDQTYTTYLDVQFVIQTRPFGTTGRVVPFGSLAMGMAYDKDRTTLDFTPDAGGGPVNMLRVDNKGWFPLLNLGIGVDIFLDQKRAWFTEFQLGYTWARMKKDQPATGLIPQMQGFTTVKADTDNTGPNILLGIGRRF